MYRPRLLSPRLLSPRLLSPRLSVPLAVAMCLSIASPTLALTFSEEEFICPIDYTTSTRIVVNSYTVFDQRLDLRPVGALMSPPPIAVCESNGFVLYQQEFSDAELVRLRAIVESDEFRSVRAANSDWYIAAWLAEQMGQKGAETHWMYLYASWEVEESDPALNREYLMLAYDRFVLGERAAEPGSDTWWTARLLRIELHRRLERFPEAALLLEETEAGAVPEGYRSMLDRERQLILERDASAQ
ncbi:MAG: hypothetical protein WD711_03260 [Dongiaceae bacterium]